METKRFSDTVADEALERSISLLADRVADRVVKVLMDGGLDKEFAKSLLVALKRQIESEE
ncbi:MAG: hypothetical protein AAGB97_09850 [Dehalococcoidia bacterium]|nr:hypothetical protein [Chloroflexota bacterium]